MRLRELKNLIESILPQLQIDMKDHPSNGNLKIIY